jgi:hypothetical protein
MTGPDLHLGDLIDVMVATGLVAYAPNHPHSPDFAARYTLGLAGLDQELSEALEALIEHRLRVPLGGRLPAPPSALPHGRWKVTISA